MAFGPAFQSNMPCNGGTAAMAADSVFLNISGGTANVPILAHLCSLGSGTTITGLLSESGTPAIGDDATLTNTDQWSQSGKGYQAALVTGASFRRATCTSSKMVPPQTGFTCAVYVKIGAALVNDAGFFGKVHSSLAQTRGFGCALDATSSNIEAWVGDRSVPANVARVSSATLVPSEYALIWMRYTETNSGAHTGDIKIRVITSAGGDELEQAGVDGTTLGMSAGSYSSYFMGGLPEGATGNLTMNGQLVWSMFWASAASDDLMAAIEADEFMGFTFPRGQVLALECPQSFSVSVGAGAVERTKFEVYIPAAFDKATDYLVVNFQGTASPALTRGQWADQTMGGSGYGTAQVVYEANSGGGSMWPTLCDDPDFPVACFNALDYYNGGATGVGNGTFINNSMLRRRTIQVFDYFDGITNNPLPTATRTQVCVTGWSAGAAFAPLFAIWHSDKVGHCVPCHSSITSNGNLSLMDTYMSSYANQDQDWTTPPSGVFANALSTYVTPSGSPGAYSNGGTKNWRTDTNAKTINFLWITGTVLTSDFPDYPSPYPYTNGIELDIAAMVSQGYSSARLKHARFTSGISAGHVYDRDRVVQFLRYGYAPFLPFIVGGGNRQMLSNDGDGLL